jgi:predicted Zn-dependent protease
MFRPFKATSAVALLSVLALGAETQAKRMAPPPSAPPSTSVTPEILDAVSAELERAMASMRIPGAPAPYFIGYKLTEVDVHDVVASLGSITDDQNRDFTGLEAHVHIGSYEQDNSNFVPSQRESLDGVTNIGLALEASPARARRSAWLATDGAYKEAIAQWQAKREAMASGVAGGASKIASYTKAPPVVTEAPVRVPKLETNDGLGERAKKLSSAFRKYDFVRNSHVGLTSFLENRWYLNSEGTNATDTRRVEGILIVATAQANDGQEVALYYSRYARSRQGLPNDTEIEAQIDAMSKQLDTMRGAPLVANYTGPVLFEGAGAVGIVRHSLAPHLSGTPPPVGIASTDALVAGKLAGRHGLKVISDLLTVVDDPTTSTVDNRFVIGGYKFDDEGVAPKRVQVIKDGKLVELLMSRTPSPDQGVSNGHARLQMPGGVYRGAATNLAISGKKAQSRAQMRKKLLAEAKAQGLPYAIIIKQFDDVEITSNTEISRIAKVQLLQSMNPQSPPPATLAYRLYPDGREELVRGVQLEPVDMRAWRDVMGVGKKRTLKNFLATTDSPFFKLIAGAGPGRVPSAGIESSITTPDLLFRELDLKASKYGLRPPPLLPAP